MPVFFNGRLFTTPTTQSAVEDSALANRNLTVGNILAIVGAARGGKPKEVQRFAGPVAARKALRSGDAAKAVQKAFDPSPQTSAPAEVLFVRVDPATQSSLTLKDASSADVIALTSTDYGAYSNQIQVKVESGTVEGKKLTVRSGVDFYTEDNILRELLTVDYTGTEVTANVTITGTALNLEAPAGIAVANITLADHETVQLLVDRINAVADFTATVAPGSELRATVNAMDFVSAQDLVAGAYTATGTLQAIVDWLNGLGEGFVDAARATGAGAVPANIDYAYLTGGADGTATNTDWADALAALQGADAQWVVPLSADASIHAMADSHCAFMSLVGRKERRALVGGAINKTIDEAIDAAKALNSDRISLVYPGYYDFDATGDLVLYPAYMTAALAGAAFAGSAPGTALTNKALKVRGLEIDVKNPVETDQLIRGGVMAVEETVTGYRVVQSISTWLTNNNYNRVEVSTGFALDFVARNVRQALDGLRGEKATPLLISVALSRAESTLRLLSVPEPNGPGVIVGDADNPPFRSLQGSIDGDVLRVQFECSPVIPANYVLATIYATPFSGVAAAA